jgi:uncharacterized protein YerC
MSLDFNAEALPALTKTENCLCFNEDLFTSPEFRQVHRQLPHCPPVKIQIISVKLSQVLASGIFY